MRILWLKTELLHPLDKGGKIRTYHMLKELKRAHDVTYLSLHDGSITDNAREKAREYCHRLVTIDHKTNPKFTLAFYGELASNLLSPLPYAIKKYQSPDMESAVSRLANAHDIDLVVCDFLAPAINLPYKLPCATVLFQHNIEAIIWRRHYEVQSNFFKRQYLRAQWKKMRAFEQAICRKFDAVVAVSPEDRDQMKREYQIENVYYVPTGVDIDFFRPTHSAAPEPNHIVFTGSMDWIPNEDGIQFFTQQIMPLIKSELPDMKLTVVGRNPSSSLTELSKLNESIVVTGRVPDVRPYIDTAAAFIVPLRIGGGTRLKIYEAMAMGKPVISTTVGAEGLPVQHQKELILADTPEEFANAVITVLRDKKEAERLGQRAAAAVRERFGWQKAAGDFAEICEETVEVHSR